jgi:general stress protein 26
MALGVHSHNRKIVQMPGKTLSDIASSMSGIDIAILSTKTQGGQIANRPMSNNGDVAYDGDSYYFTYEEALTVRDIERDPNVALGFAGKDGIFTRNGLYIAVEGRAELIRDKAAFAKHWTPDLDEWFEQGIDSPNLVLIKVHAERITYWDGMEQGDVKL